VNRTRSSPISALAAGAIAGLLGTAAMAAMRSFDRRYAPRTVPTATEDPGAFIMRRGVRAISVTGKIPRTAECAGAVLMHAGYGTLAGVAYAAVHGTRQSASTMIEGGLLGIALYAAAYTGWLPLLRLVPPAWKQTFPQIAGELLRHVVYGVTTVAAYETILAWTADADRGSPPKIPSTAG
jgi:uncharacterized membrane protein YagU involved in acid resistance